MNNYNNDTHVAPNDESDNTGSHALNRHTIYHNTLPMGPQFTSYRKDYKISPFDFKRTEIANRIVHQIEADKQVTYVTPGFIDSTNTDDLLISEFSGDSVVLCNRNMRLIKHYDMFRTAKNVFVIKSQNTFLCSDRRRTSLVDMQADKIIWKIDFRSPENPWGVTTLNDYSPYHIAVCLPSNEKVCIYDTRLPTEQSKPITEWSFKNCPHLTGRVLPYAVAPNGMITAGTHSGDGALIKCDVNSGQPTEIITRLDNIIDIENKAFIECSKEECTDNNDVVLMSSRITDICQDCDGSIIVPDPQYGKIIIRDTNKDVHLLSHANNIKRPCAVTLLRDGTLVLCDNFLNTIVTCTL